MKRFVGTFPLVIETGPCQGRLEWSLVVRFCVRHLGIDSSENPCVGPRKRIGWYDTDTNGTFGDVTKESYQGCRTRQLESGWSAPKMEQRSPNRTREGEVK